MRLGKTALYHFGSQIVITVSGFAATFVIATVLGSADLGLYTAAVAIGFFWFVVPASGVAQGIRKRMSEGEAQAEFYGGGVVINGVLAAIMGTVVLLLGRVLAALSVPDVVFVQVVVRYDVEIATLLVGATALRTTLAGLDGQKLVAKSGGVKAIDRVGRSVVQIALIAGGFGVVAITLGHAGTLIAVSVIAVFLGPVKPALPRREHVASILSYAKYAWMGALRGRVFGWLDTLVLTLFLTSASLVGIYEVAWGIGSVLATASGSIRATLFPEVSDQSVDGNLDQIIHYLDEALAYSGLIVIPGLAGAIVIGPRILRFYRPEYVRGSTVLVILVAAYVADIYGSQLLNVVDAVDRPDVSMRVNSVFIAVNLVLNVVLVLWIGWVGAAIATAISTTLRMVGGYVSLVRIVGRISIPYRIIGSEMFGGLVMTGVVLAVAPLVPPGRIGTLALVSFGATVYFATVLAVSARVREKTRYLVDSVLPTPA